MKDIKIAVFSDIHLGHKNNDCQGMLRMLDKSIFKNDLLKDIDFLIFAGDTFDRLLDLSYHGLADIDYFFARLLDACAKHNVVFRVLEGTPSHDRGQPSRFDVLQGVMKNPADFAYVDTMKIEYIERFDAHVLYIPDEYKPTTEETLQELYDLMKSKELESVDIAIMHGQFEYQLPAEIKNIPRHNQSAYEKLVKTVIFIGHVHTHSRSGKVVVQGSFDRLRHGEEEPKGFVKTSIKAGKAFVEFIENKDARIYKTIGVYDLDMGKTHEKIQKELKHLNMNACVRIEAEPNHPVFANMPELERLYPTISWSKLPKDRLTGESVIISVRNEFDDWKPIDINSSNIQELILARLAKQSFTQEQLTFAQEQLGELI
ncbi:MAG TPA: metallophosphoesterase [Acinetobacter johnsonii]|nr:metallophosphoesterase [Acinetobacter johnsonii]